MFAKILSYIGLILILLALCGLFFLSTKSFARGALTSRIQAEEAPPEEIVEATKEPTAEAPTATKELATIEPTEQASDGHNGEISGQPTETATTVPAPGPTATGPVSTSTPDLTLPVTGAEAAQPLPPVIVEAEWPREMEIQSSDSVRVSLMRVAEGVYAPTVEVAAHTIITATAVPVGTPGASLETAFGSQYTVYVSANLVGAAFEVQQLTSPRWELEQSHTWEWNITPEEGGRQTINLNIEAFWEPVNGRGQPKQRQIWRSGPLEINVVEPILVTGQISVMSIISAVIGSVLNIPRLYGFVKKTLQKRQPNTVAAYRRTLETLQGNLATLEERAAQFGLDVPLKLVNEIDATKAKIAEIEAQLALSQARGQE